MWQEEAYGWHCQTWIILVLTGSANAFQLILIRNFIFEQLHWCLVCDPGKHFLTSKFSYLLLFPIPAHKTEWKLGLQWIGRQIHRKPPGAIHMIGQSETGSSSQITFITLFSLAKCSALLCLLQQSLSKTVQEKCWAKTGIVLTSNFDSQAAQTYWAPMELLKHCVMMSGRREEEEDSREGLQLQNLHYQQRMHNRIRCSQLRRMPYGYSWEQLTKWMHFGMVGNKWGWCCLVKSSQGR